MSDSVTNYNYVGDTKRSVSIKKTDANKCTLSEIFLTEIIKSFSAFSSKGQGIQNYNLPVECNNLNLESDQSEPLGHFFGKRHSPKKSVNVRDKFNYERSHIVGKQ